MSSYCKFFMSHAQAHHEQVKDDFPDPSSRVSVGCNLEPGWLGILEASSEKHSLWAHWKRPYKYWPWTLLPQTLSCHLTAEHLPSDASRPRETPTSNGPGTVFLGGVETAVRPGIKLDLVARGFQHQWCHLGLVVVFFFFHNPHPPTQRLWSHSQFNWEIR